MYYNCSTWRAPCTIPTFDCYLSHVSQPAMHHPYFFVPVLSGHSRKRPYFVQNPLKVGTLRWGHRQKNATQPRRGRIGRSMQTRGAARVRRSRHGAWSVGSAHYASRRTMPHHAAAPRRLEAEDERGGVPNNSSRICDSTARRFWKKTKVGGSTRIGRLQETEIRALCYQQRLRRQGRSS